MKSTFFRTFQVGTAGVMVYLHPPTSELPGEYSVRAQVYEDRPDILRITSARISPTIDEAIKDSGMEAEVADMIRSVLDGRYTPEEPLVVEIFGKHMPIDDRETLTLNLATEFITNLNNREAAKIVRRFHRQATMH